MYNKYVGTCSYEHDLWNKSICHQLEINTNIVTVQWSRYVHSAHQHQPFAEWRLLFTIGSSPTRYFQFKDRFALFFFKYVRGDGLKWSWNRLESWTSEDLIRNCGPYRVIPFYLALRKSSTLLRYLRGRSSNMAIVDVEIPTGYIYTGNRFLDDFVSWQRIASP